MTEWSKSLVEWTEDETAYLSVVFTWHLPDAYQRAVWLREQGYKVVVGGPAVKLMPGYLADVAEIGGDMDGVLQRHNPEATFTSRGCIRRCAFCAVPKIEGDLVELDDWEPKRIVCDNNLLACSRRHFDAAIDSLKGLNGVDFNQGLDARLVTNYHADRLAELDVAKVRLAWDSTSNEAAVFRAIGLLRAAGMPKSLFTVYVLIGWDDDPEDARYRLESLWSRGYKPFPMRYQPLDTLRKNAYVGPGWEGATLREYMRYWANLIYTAGVPFGEWRG
jgi:hypothetical protein